jgi:hypothetical protein
VIHAAPAFRPDGSLRPSAFILATQRARPGIRAALIRS